MKSLLAAYNNSSVQKRGTILAIISFIYILVFATPPITNLLHPNAYYQFIGEQMKAPLAGIDFEDGTTHASKLAYRLTVPVFGYLLPISSLTVKYFIIYILRLAMFFYLFRRLYIYLKEKCDYGYMAEMFTFSFCFLWVGKSFLIDFMWFDEIAFFFIFLALMSKKKWLIFISVILACYTDERSYFALLLVYLYKVFFEDGAAKDIKYNISTLSKLFIQNLTIPVALVLCAGLRFYIQYTFKFQMGQLIFLEYLKRGDLDFYSIGLWAGYKNLWVIILFGMGLLYMHKHRLPLFLLIVAMILNLCVASSVYDLTRSISYSFPILLISMFYIMNYMRQIPADKKQLLYYVFITVFVASLIVPPIMVADVPDIHHNILLKVLEHR